MGLYWAFPPEDPLLFRKELIKVYVLLNCYELYNAALLVRMQDTNIPLTFRESDAAQRHSLNHCLPFLDTYNALSLKILTL